MQFAIRRRGKVIMQFHTHMWIYCFIPLHSNTNKIYRKKKIYDPFWWAPSVFIRLMCNFLFVWPINLITNFSHAD